MARPGGGPAVNDRRVYVPMTTGMIEAYRVGLMFDVDKEALRKKGDSPEELQQLEAKRRQKIHAEMTPVRPLFFPIEGPDARAAVGDARIQAGRIRLLGDR